MSHPLGHRPPALPACALPVIDLSQDPAGQVTVARQPGQFLGQVDTLLMPDGRTMFAAFPYGHGGPGCAVWRSLDTGLSWQPVRVPAQFRMLPQGAPTIHRLVAPDGTERLMLFIVSPHVMTSTSLDGGDTWTELAPLFDVSIRGNAPPKSVMRRSDGSYLAVYHTHWNSSGSEVVAPVQMISSDGGVTWSRPRRIGRHPRQPLAQPCEPALVASPDGSQLLCLLRENASAYGGLWMVSGDEGESWSEMEQLPAGLHGDRHVARYAPDGRLVVTLRDNRNPASSTRGHFIGWVGRYEDIVGAGAGSGADPAAGQYRLLLQRHHGTSNDTGYAGLEVLADGTLVATNYVAHRPWELNSIVATRFSLDQVDRLASHAEQPASVAARLPRELAAAREPAPQQTALFVGTAGDPAADAGHATAVAAAADDDTAAAGGYHTFRIPALVAAADGTLVAVCEGRSSVADHANNDLVARRSSDGGRTWGPLQIVASDGEDCLLNPTLVALDDGRLLLLFQRYRWGYHLDRCPPGTEGENVCRTFVMESSDAGASWGRRREITADVKAGGEVTANPVGPGIGIQMTRGRHRGRVLAPFVQQRRQPGGTLLRSVGAALSDDRGASWRLSATVAGGPRQLQAGELQFVERSDGSVLLNARSGAAVLFRLTAVSDDGGASWSQLQPDPVLIEPPCQASILRYSFAPTEAGAEPRARDRIVFANPSDNRSLRGSRRRRMTVRLSYDGGSSWPEAKCLHPGSAAYSSLARLPDGDGDGDGGGAVGLLFERNDYREVVFARVELAWLTDGRDRG